MAETAKQRAAREAAEKAAAEKAKRAAAERAAAELKAREAAAIAAAYKPPPPRAQQQTLATPGPAAPAGSSGNAPTRPPPAPERPSPGPAVPSPEPVHTTRAGGSAAQFSLPGMSAAQNATGGQVMSILTNGGLSDAVAAGMVGNWVQESSLNVDEPGGYLAQWGGSRLAALAAFAQGLGLPVVNVEAQSRFALHELATDDPVSSVNLHTTTDPEGAARAISNEYERPATSAANLPRREQYARYAYDAWTGGGRSPGPPSQGSAGGNTGGQPVVEPVEAHIRAFDWSGLVINAFKDVRGGSNKAASISGEMVARIERITYVKPA